MFNKKFHKLEKSDQRSVLAGMISAGTNHEGQSNREFAEKNGQFIQACESVGLKPTVRQAGKFRRGLGLAFANKGN